MAFRGSYTLVTELSVLKLLKLSSVYYLILLLLFKQYSSQSQKRTPPSFWTKVVSIERKTSKIRLCTKKSTLLASENSKIIEVLCMKENN